MVEGTALHIRRTKEFSAQKKVTIFGVSFSLIEMLLLGTISLILLLQLQLQFTQKLNWDEFFYLSHIYDAQAGRLDKTLQMGHVYLFRWLTYIPGGEMVQITMGRVVMWAAQIGTLGLIVKTARRFMPLEYALFSALCFLGLGFVFVHGTSFRADPVAGLCMMLVVYVFAASDLQRKDLAVLAVALAFGAFVTIKVVLFAPLFAVLALWRLSTTENKRAVFVKFVTTLLVSAGAFLVALLLHKLTLPITETADPTRSLSSTAETVFLSGGLFPRKDIYEVGFITGFVPTVMVAVGVMTAIICAIKDKPKRFHYLTIFALALPLLTFIFYRNAYPYFYAFICPSAIILAGYAAYELKLPKIILAILSIFILCSTVLLYTTRFDETRDVQTQTLSAVHQLFPEPVSYFDRNGMIASFPKAGFFMSSWGLRRYTMSGERQFIREMEIKTVPLLIENSPAISAALKGQDTSLFAEDARALRENYIPHWGHIWVAGKILDVSGNLISFNIAVPGTYTLEADGLTTINHKQYQPGDTIVLERGEHLISKSRQQIITLRWGDNLTQLEFEASQMPIFGPF